MDGMADLRIDDVTTAGADAGLRAAASRLAPGVGAVRSGDAGAAGVNALAGGLEDADQSLAAALESLGRELASFATWIAGAADGLASTDRAIASQAPR